MSFRQEPPVILSQETDFKRLLNACRLYLDKGEGNKSAGTSGASPEAASSSNTKRLLKYADALQDYLHLLKSLQHKSRLDPATLADYESQVRDIVQNLPQCTLSSPKQEPLLCSTLLGSGDKTVNLPFRFPSEVSVPTSNSLPTFPPTLSSVLNLTQTSANSNSVAGSFLGYKPMGSSASTGAHVAPGVPLQRHSVKVVKPCLSTLKGQGKDVQFAPPPAGNYSASQQLNESSRNDPASRLKPFVAEHETLTDDLLKLTSQLKSNSLHLKSAVSTRGELLDQADAALDASLQRTQDNVKRATAHRQRRGTGCLFLTGVLFTSFAVFFAMIFYIKASSMMGSVGAHGGAAIRLINFLTIRVPQAAWKVAAAAYARLGSSSNGLNDDLTNVMDAAASSLSSGRGDYDL